MTMTRGFYHRPQRYFDAESLTYHNLDIMTCEALRKLAPEGVTVRAFPFGRLSAWHLSLGKRWPGLVARGASHLANAVALLQPFDIPALSPMLVLEITRPAR